MIPLSDLAADFDAPQNPLYALRSELLQKGKRVIDLVSGNVNSQGIIFPPNVLKKALLQAQKKAAFYKPDPLGQKAARDAIGRYYGNENFKVPSENILLTPGTSISYWYAFKLLASTGDEILAPVPSYPLFDSIAKLSGIKLIPYHLREAARWEIDFDSLEAAITPRTKAIVLISPHNPTGTVATEEEVKQLAEIASRRNLAIIADEVFSPFILSSSPAGSGRGSMDSPPRAAGNDGRGILPRPGKTKAPLVLTLNGFSKMLALPGFKIGWMAVTGDQALVNKVMKTLDMMSDTFLPVSEIAQFSVGAILSQSKIFQRNYAAEIYRRMTLAVDILKDHRGISFIRPEGGFFMALRLETPLGAEKSALKLLKNHGLLIHPGYFYDMEGEHLVFSFVSRPAVLSQALKALLDGIE